MKPNVDLNRAFAILIEDGRTELKDYMNRLNAEHFWKNGKSKAEFNEDGTPRETKTKETSDYSNMSYNQVKQLADERGLLAGITGNPKKTVLIDLLTREDDRPVYGQEKPSGKGVTEKLKIKDMKEFPDDVLYIYLQSKSNSRESSDEAIMRGDSLQGRLSVNADGTAKNPSTVRADVESELEEKFPNLFDEIKAKDVTIYIDELVRQGYGKAVTGDEATTTRLSASEVIAEAKADSDISRILSMFKQDGKKVDARIFDLYFRNYAPKKTVRRNISWGNYVKRNIRLGFTDEDVDEAIDILETSIPEYFVPIMHPFKMMLKQLDAKKQEGEARYRVSLPRASEIIGRLDTKALKRREQIYEYWSDISGKFSDFTKAHDAFLGAMDKIDDEYSEELQSTFKKFKAVKVDDLNYVQRHDRIAIDDIDNIEQKSIMLLQGFLKEVGKYPDDKLLVTEENTDGETTTSPKGIKTIGGEKPKGTDADVKEKKTPEEIMQEMREAARQAEAIEDEEEALKDKINSLTKIKVDPLYAYAMEKGETEELKSGAIISKQLKEISRRLKTGMVIVDMGYLVPSLDRYIKDLEKMQSGNLDNTYLPVMKEIDESQDLKVHDRIANYIKLFNEFIEYGDDFERSSKGASSGLGQGAKKDKEGRTIREARSPRTTFGGAGAGKTHIKEIKDLNIATLFEKLTKAIVAFFIEPSRSRNKPSDEPLDFITKTGSRPIENISKETSATDSPFIQMLRMESEDFTLDLSELEDIRDFMRLLTSLNVGSKQNELIVKTTDLADTIDDIFEGELTEQVNVEFGHFLHNIFTDANLESKPFGLGTKSQTDKLAEKYDKNKMYPFETLFYHLMSNRTSSAYKDMKGADSIIQNIIQAETDLKITKSDEETLILQAHDEIRKMLGKPIYYGMSNVDNYNAVSEAIDYMNVKYKTDMTAMDIENIVKDFDSMSSLGTKYGIPQEGVYFLKANFR